MSVELTLTSDGLESTHRIGRRLGAALQAGQVIALIGPLGAGKTTLVKGIADGAGVADLYAVNSPTFVIVNEYEAASGAIRGAASAEMLRIYHVDAYRLRGGTDLDALGFDEMCSSGAVIVEWADRVEEVLPADRLEIHIEPTGETSRRFSCRGFGEATAALVGALSMLAGGEA